MSSHFSRPLRLSLPNNAFLRQHPFRHPGPESVQRAAEALGIFTARLHAPELGSDADGIKESFLVTIILGIIIGHLAVELIRNRNLSLAEAAFSVGIGDPAYMSRLFKKTMGLSYREFFKQNNPKKD